MLPNVLCIGVQRGGTTWLYDQFLRHPEVYVSKLRKEIHYFDLNYDKGVSWYKKHYPDDLDMHRYRFVADVTPMYIYHPDVPGRIYETLGKVKIIVMLRNPVDRAASQYRLHKRQYNIKLSFREFIKKHPEVIDRGFYTKQLQRYYKYYDKGDFHYILYDDIVASTSQVLDNLSLFLGIERDGFNDELAARVSNEGFLPRFGSLYAGGKMIVNYLRRNEMDYIIYIIKKMNLGALAGRRNGKITITDNDKSFLQAIYKDEITELETLLDIKLSSWRR